MKIALSNVIMNKIQRQTYEIIDYTKLVIVVIVCIWIVYFIAKELAGELPATIGSVVFGVAWTFIFVVSKKARNSMLSWVKKRK